MVVAAKTVNESHNPNKLIRDSSVKCLTPLDQPVTFCLKISL